MSPTASSAPSTASADLKPARRTLTVAISNYNHARYLPRAIDAILAQTRPPDELILVDDKSTDDSVDIIREYAARVPLIRPIFREHNGGFNAGISDALTAATGDYFYAGAADDFIFPQFFIQAMAAAEEYPQAGLICGDWELRQLDETVLSCRFTANPQRRFIHPQACVAEFIARMPPALPPSVASIFRTECVRTLGGYRPKLGSSTDTFLILTLSARYGAAYVPETFAAFYDHPTGFSSSDRKNFSGFVEIINETVRIFQTEFHDVFSSAVIQDWRARSFKYLIKGYVDLTTPYQDVLRFEDVVSPRQSSAEALLRRIVRKLVSFGILSYQSLIHRNLTARLIQGNQAEQPELTQQITKARQIRNS